ncbi:MAG: hypothetical protein NVS2B4_09690 [Ramlibacter sp.]
MLCLVQLGQIGYHGQMEHLRSITSSDAKASLGEVLGSLASEGPVEITRNGRPVGVLSAPAASERLTNRAKLADLAKLYASGVISWPKVSEESGASFGELLVELGRQTLSLPVVTAPKRPAQAAVFHEALRQGALKR